MKQRDDIIENMRLTIEAGDPLIIHVIVALCDNEHQGIVPVAAKLGDGEDLMHNLYWGAAYGVKTFFKNSNDWIMHDQDSEISESILERCIFKHVEKNAYLIADAYRGSAIKNATEDFLSGAAGLKKGRVLIDQDRSDNVLDIDKTHMIVYVGHNGLMDFDLEKYPQPDTGVGLKDAVILACASKQYFKEILFGLWVYPLVWTEGLCAPEAYVLKGMIDGWLNTEDAEQIRDRAANAYSKYQKCSIKAARMIFTTGW